MIKLRALLTGLLLALLTACCALTAHAAPSAQEVDVQAVLDEDGSLRVTTTIRGANLGEEVTQRLPRTLPDGELRTFRYTFSDVEASVDGAEPAPTEPEADGEHLLIRVPTQGSDSITIDYTVEGTTVALDGDDAHHQFHWRLLPGLNLDVQTVQGSLRTPTTPPDFECQAGDPANTHNCALWNIDRHTPERTTFVDGPLMAGEILDVTASQPKELLAATADVEHRWTLDRAFSLTPPTALASLAVLALGALALWSWHRLLGRDATPSAQPTVIAEFHPVGDGISEFRLVAEIRPGQVGTVADESVDPVDVTATLLDLAVRGHLVIEQLDIPGGTDWAFHRTDAATDALRPYEVLLLDAVAPLEGSLVMASTLSDAVGPMVPQLQHALYDDVVAQGWFDKHPEAARTDSRTVGAALLVVGLVVTALLAWLTTWGLVGAAVVAVGVGALFIAGEMPRRSPKGAALLAGLHGFSAILGQQRTDVFPAGRELTEISKVLPYAVVLGGKDRWVQAMVAADEDDDPDPMALHWFRAPKDWHLQQLPQSMDALIASIQGHLFGR